jgi:hypothetical protein
MEQVINLAAGATKSPVDRGDQDPNEDHSNVVAYMMVLYPMFMSLGIVGSVVGIFY